MIWYKVGAADETAGKSGLAHFLEHLMFKGTAQNPGNRFSQAVAAIGGQENAFTASDYTGFFQRVPREHLQGNDGVRGRPHYRSRPDRRRRAARAQCRARRTKHADRQQSEQPLAEQMDAALYLNHPYGRPTIGWRPEIEKLDRDDALAFYRRFYSPNNAIVVVAGDVTAEEVKADAEATYGKMRGARRCRAAPAAAGTTAGGAAHGDAGRPAGRAAEHQSLLSRAVANDRQAGRERGARSVGARARQRLEQPALSLARARQRRRVECRRLLFEYRARLRQIRRLRLAEAGQDTA